MTAVRNPLEALEFGQWFKLICGASYQDVSAIRNLSLIYGLAGADCIDVAADLAVVHAAHEGIGTLRSLTGDVFRTRPWLMVSLNDGQDPHFRKAWFDGQRCPTECSRPCQAVCPAEAIGFTGQSDKALGVFGARCYGCGRCLPICPHGLIEEQAFTVSVKDVLPLLIDYIDAVEIHTQIGRQREFQILWQQLVPYLPRLQLVSISCPDSDVTGDAIIHYLTRLYRLMTPKPNRLLWQTDGRSMSGDIGKGTTRAAIKLAQKVLTAHLPGYVQLAGGTNNYTVDKLRSLNLLPPPQALKSGSSLESSAISGVAYGSYARRLVNPGDGHLENHPDRLWHQVSLARELVTQIKPDIGNAPDMSEFIRGFGAPASALTMNIPP